MTLRPGAAWALFGALAAGCGAAGTGRAAESNSGEGVPVGDLPAAVPSGGAATERGRTGEEAVVVMGGRRDRVADLFQRYVVALANRDIAALVPLLDQTVADLNGGEPLTRDRVIENHENALARLDPSLLATLPHVHAIVRSSADLHRVGRAVPTLMHTGDWLVEVMRAPASTAIGSLLPRTMLVRWVGDEPIFTAMSRAGRMP